MIPNVLNAPAAVVSTSTKPDVLEATMFRRWVLGNVFVFDPTGTLEIPRGAYPLRWSPVVGCDTFEPQWPWPTPWARRPVRARCSPNRPTGSSGPRVCLAPLLFAAKQRGGDMAAVCRWVLARDLREPLAALEDSGHEMAQAVLAGVVATDDRERSGIFSTASGLLAAYRSEAALATTRDVNFDPARFVRSTDALYICAPAHAQEQLAPLVVALLEQIRSAVYARPEERGAGRLRPRRGGFHRAAAFAARLGGRRRGTGAGDHGLPPGPLPGPGALGRGGCLRHPSSPTARRAVPRTFRAAA